MPPHIFQGAFEGYEEDYTTEGLYVPMLHGVPHPDPAHLFAVSRESRKRDGCRCVLCNRGWRNGVQLNMHHRTYNRWGKEGIGDLTTLCRKHHAEFHGVSLPERRAA